MFVEDVIFGWDWANESATGSEGWSESLFSSVGSNDSEFRSWVDAVCGGGPSGFGSSEMDSVLR